MANTYEFRFRGRLSGTLKHEFAQLGLTEESGPVETVLTGSVEDQAALHGLLRWIESLGLDLVEVRRSVAAEGESKRAAGSGSD